MRDSNDPEQLGLAILETRKENACSITEAADLVYASQARDGWHFGYAGTSVPLCSPGLKRVEEAVVPDVGTELRIALLSDPGSEQ